MSLDTDDRLAIAELLSLYGHLIDTQRWTDLDQVFTQDAVFDASDFGKPIFRSLDELRSDWAADMSQHPLAHHATNIVMSVVDDGTVRVMSKGLGVGDGGRVGSVTYDDLVVRTPDGWRLSHRHATLRRPRR